MSKIKKLGYGIVAFEGTEHIKNITSEVRDKCDIIVVCLQKMSYHNTPILQSDIGEVESLKRVGLVDEIIWFEPKSDDFYSVNKGESIGIVPRLKETDKRNYILDYLEVNGCSHAIITDSDEYYDGVDFTNTYNLIDNDENIKITYCQYINYYKDYKHLLVWPYICYVPFISEIKYRFDFRKGSFNKPSDPTRRYVTDSENNCHIFYFNTIKMHHLSWIRLNIENKIDNWSSKLYFKGDIKTKILDRYYDYKDGENAIITFNVPNYEVVVNNLGVEYIHPKYKLNYKFK